MKLSVLVRVIACVWMVVSAARVIALWGGLHSGPHAWVYTIDAVISLLWTVGVGLAALLLCGLSDRVRAAPVR